MMYDPRAPIKLRKTQKWFADIITRPIDEESLMNPVSPTGHPMEQEAKLYIRPSPTMRPAQRIQIYNQQYWWRLLKALQEMFPLLTRLFGYRDFNELIATPYLVKYPPDHWSLSVLGERLSTWIAEDYHAADKKLVQDCALIEQAYNHCFCAAELPPITSNEGEEEALLTKTLYLQPHIHLFALDYNLFLFRSEFLKHDPEYWLENDFPPLPKEVKFFVLFRNHHQDIRWNEISTGEFHLLKQFKQGVSIDDACQWLEQQEGAVYDEASRNLHKWFQEWIVRKWLSTTHPRRLVDTKVRQK